MADRPAIETVEQRAGAQFTATARRLGIYSAASIVILGLVYSATLAVGFSSLEVPRQPIGDPMFSILEMLIMVMMPPMIATYGCGSRLGAGFRKAAQHRGYRFHGLARRRDLRRAFRYFDVEPADHVCKCALAAATPIVPVAVRTLRARHSWVGCLFRAFHAFCRPRFQREPAGHIDPRLDDLKRGNRAGWFGRRRRKRYAHSEHRHRWLCPVVSGSRGTAGSAVLQD